MDENEWTLAQIRANEYSDYWEESSDKTGHWNVHDKADLRDQCDVEIIDWWHGEWSFDNVLKYSNSKGYHGFTMDKNSNIVFFKRCSGQKKIEEYDLDEGYSHLITYLQQDFDYRDN